MSRCKSRFGNVNVRDDDDDDDGEHVLKKQRIYWTKHEKIAFCESYKHAELRYFEERKKNKRIPRLTIKRFCTEPEFYSDFSDVPLVVRTVYPWFHELGFTEDVGACRSKACDDFIINFNIERI